MPPHIQGVLARRDYNGCGLSIAPKQSIEMWSLPRWMSDVLPRGDNPAP